MNEDPIKKPFPHNILRQPKYMYVWQNHKGEVRLFGDGLNELPIEYKYIGKIQLETAPVLTEEDFKKKDKING